MRPLPDRIHILGASGTGTTTLASAIAAKHGHRHLDIDDFFWVPTDPPYREIRPRDQQLAKNLWLSPSRNPLRKLEEAILTWQLERALPKRRILELYLNVVEFGPGVYGVEAASRRYFGKPAAEVTDDEAAELAASLPSPTTWHPGSSRRGYRRHVESIKRRMAKATFLGGQISAVGAAVSLSRQHKSSLAQIAPDYLTCGEPEFTLSSTRNRG